MVKSFTIEFPCGLILQEQFRFDEWGYSKEEIYRLSKNCPLHGKNVGRERNEME